MGLLYLYLSYKVFSGPLHRDVDHTVHASAMWYSNIIILMFAREDWCEGDEKNGKSVPLRKRENKTIYINIYLTN